MISSIKPSVESFFYSPKFQTSRDILLVGATITTVALSIIFAEPLALSAAAIPLAIYIYSRYKRINPIQPHQQNLPNPTPIPRNPSSEPNPVQKHVNNLSSVLSQPVPQETMLQTVLEDEPSVDLKFDFYHEDHNTDPVPQTISNTPVIQPVLEDELDSFDLESNPYEAAVILGEECLKNEIFIKGKLSTNCESIKNNLLTICRHFHLKVENMERGFVIFNQEENHTFGDIKHIKNQLFFCFLALYTVEESTVDIIENKEILLEAIQQLLDTIRSADPSAPQPLQESKVIQSPEIIEHYEAAAIFINTYSKFDFSKDYTNEEWSKLEERLRDIGGLFGLRFYVEIENKYNDELGIDISEEFIESRRDTTSNNFAGINYIEIWLKHILLALRYIKTSEDKEIITIQKNNLSFYLEQLKNVVYESCPAIPRQE